VRITSWFVLSDSVYVSRELNNDQDLATQKFIRDFALEEYRTVVKAELKKEEASLKALEKELDNLIKEEEKAAKKIDENKRAIQRANDNIGTGNADIQSIAYKISSQKEMVEKTAADKNANQGAKKTLKELENSKKSLQKGNENEAKSITKMNAEIRDAERSIADSKEKQKPEDRRYREAKTEDKRGKR
jgi:chromosome segregation ATPase